ncbi:MAG: SpoIIE family protein phosphatase [Actinobacteria bacterium]|nr:SpoIIE family protein phosphatase [Actinomycetota bacterium]
MSNPSSTSEDSLRDLSTITDVELAHLDVESLLDVLLERVRDILNADTAAVLLLDESRRSLVATAARGIEAEVRQGVRIPLGSGFAGRIANDRRPVVLDRVDATTVYNPILWEQGINAMLGVPLMAGGDVIGVLHVGSRTPRSFTPEDVRLLQLAADRVSLGIQSRVLAAERAAANILQRSLLPGDLPVLPGVEFAARYVPAARGGVGGDWYDVFLLPSGELCMVIGDVAGHGVRPAVVMGRVRSALRAYALENNRPEAILELVDRKLQYFEAGYMVTALCAIADDNLRHVTIASAGHLAPVLASGDGPAALIDMAIDAPLGVVSGIRRTATTVELPPAGVLLLYTDGLVERRDVDLDTRLATLKNAVRAESADVVCTRVMHHMIGEEAAEDDVAILAVGWSRAAVGVGQADIS